MLRNTAKTAILPCSLLLIAALSPAQAESAKALVSEGNEAYAGRRYQDALNAYEEASKTRPDSPHIWFNKGDALYQQGQFSSAMDAYEQTALHGNDAGLAARGRFNQGNALFREGVQQGQANPSQAVESLEKGVRLYQDALTLDPTLDDAGHNIEVARRAIQMLREQMEKQPQQGDQDKDSKDEQSDQDKADDDQQQQGEQDDSSQQQQEQQKEQNQQQQSQAGDEQKEEKPQAAEAAQDILNKERENKRRRQVAAVVGIRPVDKDW